MMSLIVPLIPLASKPRPACLAATAAAHKLPDGRRAQTAHFQLSYYECKVPTNVTDVCPISNSPTTSATKLRMCGGGRVQGGCPSPACGRRRRRWRWAAGGGRACRPHHPTEAGVRRLQQAVGIGVTAAAAAVGARSVCVRQECAARRRSSRLVGWRAGGGLWRRCERRAWSPPLGSGHNDVRWVGGREGSGRDDVARAVCGRRARRVHIAA